MAQDNWDDFGVVAGERKLQKPPCCFAKRLRLGLQINVPEHVGFPVVSHPPSPRVGLKLLIEIPFSRNFLPPILDRRRR
jgi:hypothetical protein